MNYSKTLLRYKKISVKFLISEQVVFFIFYFQSDTAYVVFTIDG